jgi:hypothetical protein
MTSWCSVQWETMEISRAGHGVTQGSPLSTKLFNLLVDAVMREWIWQLQEDRDYNVEELAELI